MSIKIFIASCPLKAFIHYLLSLLKLSSIANKLKQSSSTIRTNFSY